jgi:hypothetical protein
MKPSEYFKYLIGAEPMLEFLTQDECVEIEAKILAILEDQNLPLVLRLPVEPDDVHVPVQMLEVRIRFYKADKTWIEGKTLAAEETLTDSLLGPKKLVEWLSGELFSEVWPRREA